MTKKIEIVSGQVFHSLTVIKEAEKKNNNGSRCFECSCSCGNITVVNLDKLRSGHTKSCGCKKKERFLRMIRKHSLVDSPLYNVWTHMKKRCYNKVDKEYSNYGGRGISVCECWKNDFKQFHDDMIETYAIGLQIDRINNNGDYCQENCRWVTPKENVRNRRISIKVMFRGDVLSLQEVSDITGISYDTLHNRHTKNIPLLG